MTGHFYPGVNQIMRCIYLAVLLGYKNERRMLENGCHHFNRFTVQCLQQQFRNGYSEFCLAGKHTIYRILLLVALLNGHIEPCFTVITLFQSCIVSGKLKLMKPA